MLLRPFLNDVGSCASYLFGCTSHAKLAVVDPHADFVDAYVAAAAAIGAPIVAVFETHVQADHVSGPARAGGTDRRDRLPAGGCGRRRSSTSRSDDGDVVELGNTLVTADRDTGARTGPSRVHGHRPAAWQRRAVAGVQRRLAADRRCRPPRPACRRRRARPGTAAARKSAAAAGAARLRRSLSEPLRRLGLRPRSLGQPDLLDRVRALAQSAARSRRVRMRSPTRSSRRCRRGRSSRSGSSPPTARVRSAPSHDRGPSRAASERPPVRSARRAERACRRYGRPGAKCAAACRRAGLRPDLDRHDPRLRGRLRRGARRSPTSRPAIWPSGSDASGSWWPAGLSRCRCRC